MIKFSEMPYKRPDVDNLVKKGREVIASLAAASSPEEAETYFYQMEDMNRELDTMYSLAYVRHTIDTTDEFYDKEMEYLDQTLPLCQEVGTELGKAMLASPFRAQLEKKFGPVLFKNLELQQKSFSPAIIPDLQEENRLVTEYGKLIASAQIPFEGGVHTLSQLTPFKSDRDDERRAAAWKAEGEFYQQNGEKLDSLYADLVTCRDRMAKKMGYPNYVTLGYYRMNRNSYTKEDVEKFRAAVRKYVVPLADQVYQEQAKRLHVSYPLTFANAALSFRSGNAKPQGTPEEILEHGKKMYHEMSPLTKEFIDFLYEGELLDVLSKKGKAGGGYCTTFAAYKAPFIFANFNGTQGDVEVITHEAGHAFAAYMARDIEPADNQNPTMESCEIHSMSMEFFAWPWATGFFGADTDKFYYGHLAGALTFLPYGTMVDHFQHIMYEKPELTADQRHQVWRELLGIYMPWMAIDGSAFYGEAKGWQRQMHIYERPFYYIDYCLAQAVALQFWAKIQQDRTDAWERYISLVKKAGTETFDQLVATAGLSSPFGDEGLAEVAKEASKWLSAFDQDKLK